jgi:hypothetical protein
LFLLVEETIVSLLIPEASDRKISAKWGAEKQVSSTLRVSGELSPISFMTGSRI